METTSHHAALAGEHCEPLAGECREHLAGECRVPLAEGQHLALAEKRHIALAQEHQKEEILALYRSMLGGAADWDEHYPTMLHINEDMARNNLFVMTEGESADIIATISIDEDEVVAALPNWNPTLEPAGELSRICVRQDRHNRGIARTMMEHTFAELRRRGCKGVHILIREGHKVATRSYMHLGYQPAGQCQLFGKDFDCYERPL